MFASTNGAVARRLAVALALTVFGANATADGDSIVVTPQTFKCLQDMTAVRGFFVDNIADERGNIDLAARISRSWSERSVLRVFR